MITNRDCFFNKKSDFINRLPDISPNSVVYIADTQQIWTQNKYFECAMTPDRVEELILAHGYLVADDIPNLTGGAVATNGQYVSGVTVDGHQVNISKGNFSDINAGSASKLEIPRTISLTGDVSGSISFDGSSNVSISSTVADNSHNHTISNISNLNSGWDSLLSNTPSAYVTRWPSISEVADKQNLVIKLNGGTTEGTNQFTYNGTTTKTLSITPGSIGAAASSHSHSNYVQKSGDTMTGILVIDTSVPDLLHIDSSNNTQTFINVFRNGTQKAAFGYYDGRGSFMYNWVGGYYFELTDGGGLQLHKGGTLLGNILHSGNIGSYALTPSNYTSYLDSRYVNASGDTMTGVLNISSSSEALVRYQISGSNKAASGYLASQGAYLYSWPAGKYLHITDAGSLLFDSSTVWHSGNDGSGSGLDADLLDGYQGSDYLRSFWTTQPGYDASQYVNDSFSTFTYSNNAPYTGPLFHLGASGYGVYFNTAYTYDSPLAYKRHGSNGDGGMGEWQYLARTSDLTWSNISGKPSSYTPASHSHSWNSITSKPIALSTNYGNNNNSITTTQFLDLLEAQGLFGWGISRGSWYYAGNQAITDTGIGNIHLSGAAIQVIGYRGACTIIVITPTTDSGNVVGETKRMFIYVDNGSSYAPGWFKLARTDELPSFSYSGGVLTITT